MSLIDLPSDIWYNIIVDSGVSIKDVTSLIKTCKTLSKQLRDEHIWRGLCFRDYECILKNYAIDETLGSQDVKEESYYSKTSKYKILHKQVIAKLSNQSVGSLKSLQSFTEMCSQEQEYLSVLIKEEKRAYEYIDCKLSQHNCLVDLVKLSFLKNSIVGINFMKGFGYLKVISNQHSQEQRPDDLERFWLRISLFDTSYHHLVKYRRKKLTQIKDGLNQFYSAEIIEKGMATIDYNGDKLALKFENMIALKKFLTRLIAFVASYFTVESKYYKSDCPRNRLEDYSIVRIYANCVKGDKILLLTLFAKVVQQFLFDEFLIHVSGVQLDVSPEVTKNFLKIGPFCCLIDHICSVKVSKYKVTMFDAHEILNFTRGSSSTRCVDILSPLSTNDLLKYYTNLEQFDLNTDSLEERYHLKDIEEMDPEDMHRFKKLDLVESYFPPKIFISMLRATSKLDALFVYNNYFALHRNKPPNAISYLHNSILLGMIKSHYSDPDTSAQITEIYERYISPALLEHAKIQNAISSPKDSRISPSTSGTIVYNKRLQTLGIIVGDSTLQNVEDDLNRVLTKFSLQRWKGNNMLYLSTKENYAPKFIIRSFDMDVFTYSILKSYHKTSGGANFGQ